MNDGPLVQTGPFVQADKLLQGILIGFIDHDVGRIDRGHRAGRAGLDYHTGVMGHLDFHTGAHQRGLSIE